MFPPSLPSLALRIARSLAYQAFHRENLPEPLPGRFCKESTPASVGRNVVLDAAHRGDLGAIADPKMVVDAYLGAQRHVVANRQAAGEPDLGRQQTMPADRHIVADLDLIVDFCAFADH